MYKEVTYRYDKYIKSNMQKVINIYFDDVLVDPTYITEFKKGGTLFNKELELGSTPSQYIELKIHKRANIPIPNQIRVEFGVLVNNALTLYEVNKMLLGELNVTPIRSLAKYNYNFEMIPIGIFNVDDYSDKDSNLITIKAYDNIIKLENDSGYYDITPILKQDSNNRKYATLGEIAEDICKKKGLELGSKSFLNSNKKMYVYDNSITAREYIGYIAECAGCFACSGHDGKIYFRSIGEDTIEIPQNLFKTYKYGEQYKISRVAYENGIESFKFGTATNNTLWLNQDNIFITDEDEVNNIYNKVKNLTVYSFEGTAVIDPRIDIGDIIIVDGKKIIYQGEMTFGGRPRANIKSEISMKARSETTVKKPSQKTINRRVQSRIDEAEGKIEQIIEEVYEEDGISKISKHEQTINGFKDTVAKVENLESDSITKVDVMYALSSSSTTAPTSGWQTTAPAWKSGKYMWQKTITTYADKSTEESEPTCISGANGKDGTNGTNGKDGVGIKTIEEQYYLSSSNVTQIGGSWKTTQDTWSEGKYIWTRTKITWTDNTTTYTNPVLAAGLNTANSNAKIAVEKSSATEATVSGITNTVSEIHKKVNNMKIGGTNLLRGTNTVDKLGNGKWSESSWRQASGGTGTRQSINVEKPPNNNIKLGWYISSTNSQVTICQDNVPTTNQEEYTLSCYAKGSGKLYLQYGNATLGYQNTQIDVTSEWKEYSYAFKSKGTANAYFGVNATDYDIQICGMKLEKGNINSDWSPAPEDTEEILSKMNSTIEQTASSITQKVNELTKFSREITATNQLHLSDTVQATNLVLSLKIYGDTNKFKVLPPSASLTPSANLMPYGTTFDLVIDTKPRTNPSTNAVIHKIQMPEPLRNNGNVRDELNIANGKVTIIRRINNSGNVLATESVETYDDISLETFKGDTYIYIREYQNVEYFCRYVIDNDYLDTFATQKELQNATVALNSLIEQKQNEITLLVSQKVGKNEVISSINLTPEKAKILAKFLQLEGYTTINGNFKIDEQGNMETVNGKFIGGNIFLTETEGQQAPCFTVEIGNQRAYIRPDLMAIISNYSSASGNYQVNMYADDSGAQFNILDTNSKGCTIRPNSIYLDGDIYAYEIHTPTYSYDSRVELKENIKLFKKNALELIKDSNIYQYKYKGINNSQTIGLVIGDGYKTPEEVISNGEGINSYSMNGLSWKAIQELDEKIEKILKTLKKIPILGKIVAKLYP